MTIGFLTDVHGDLDGLEWALGALASADRVICLGDVCGGRQDAACIDRLRASPVEVIGGNHDYWTWLGPRFDGERRAWLEQLPLWLDGDGWTAVHSRYEANGTLRHWRELRGSLEVKRFLGAEEQPIVFCGHTHEARIDRLGSDGLELTREPVLRERPVVSLDLGCRHLVTVGWSRDCVALFDEAAREVRFVFRFLQTG